MLLGWRQSTLDVDLKLDPEAPGIFDAIPGIKDALAINIVLASPDQFIPVAPGWQERSTFIERAGPLEVFHYDFAAQALCKIERGHHQDVLDVREMIDRGLVTRETLWMHFRAIRPQLNRYPAIDPDAFEEKVRRALGEDGGRGDP